MGTWSTDGATVDARVIVQTAKSEAVDCSQFVTTVASYAEAVPPEGISYRQRSWMDNK